MKIIFLGSAQFAVACLRALRESGHEIACVVTQPDKKKGRGLHLEGTPVKQCAHKSGLKIYQPESINSPEAVKTLKNYKADFFVVVAYGQILSQEILDLPKLFVINAHASILPSYRGAAPINWALIRGEHKTGVSIMKVIRKMDAGPVIRIEEVAIEHKDDAISLEEKLSLAAAGALVKSIKDIESGSYSLVPQDETKATLAPKLKKEYGLIDWAKSAQEICNLVRGCVVWPGAYTSYKGKLLKIFRAQPVENLSAAPAGQIIEVSREAILVAAGIGAVFITELQMEAKRRMNVEEFISGHDIRIGDRFLQKK